MKVKCIKLIDPNTGEPVDSRPLLTIGRIYHVLEVFCDEQHPLTFRFLGDDKMSPALFDANQFELVSNKIPEEWCVKFVPGSYFKLTPKAWANDGFWEDYSDCDAEAERIFNEVAKKIVTDEPVEDPEKPSFFPPWSPF